MKRDLRNFDRTRIPENSLLPCQAADGKLTGHISVLGAGGAFIRTRDLHAVGTALTLRIDGRGEIFEAESVVRDIQPGGVGVSFNRLPAKQKENLKKILSRVKE